MNFREANVPCVGEAAVRKPESVMEMIGKSYDIEKRIVETLRRMENTLFGRTQKEEKEEEPRCLRDVCAMHLKRMGEIDEVLRSIAEKLGV